MARAQDFQRRAQFFLDFVEAEKLDGLSCTQEAAASLASQSISPGRGK